MKRRTAAIFIALVVVLALGGLWALRRRSPQAAPPPAAAATPDAAPPAVPPNTAGGTAPNAAGGTAGETVDLTLYFPGADGRLYAERREAQVSPGAAARARAALEGLLAGPRSEGLRAPLPAGVEIGSLVLLTDGTVIVDLRSAEREQPPSSGSLAERTTVYSLVDTVLMNAEGSRRVTLLWNGVQRESFAGHLDTTRPLAADTSILAPR